MNKFIKDWAVIDDKEWQNQWDDTKNVYDKYQAYNRDYIAALEMIDNRRLRTDDKASQLVSQAQNLYSLI